MPKFYVSLVFYFSFFEIFAQSQPPQPASGPGGSDYIHGDVVMYSYEAEHDGYYIFEPASPTPDSANLVLFIHGLGLVNPYLYGAWINHLVKHGNIVIYPKYQNAAMTTPSTSFNANVITAIVNALDTLALPGHVKPRTENFAVAGHSYGGLMTANMGILAATEGFPVPKALFSCQGYTDNAHTTRLPDYSIMPAEMNMLIVVGDNDAIVGTTFGRFLMDSTVNVPTSHKNFITHHSDNHGSPAIGSTHFEPCSRADEFNTGESNLFITVCAAGTKTDAVDYYCYWKLFDALMDCAFYSENCEYAFGDTPEQHGMGEWSDGQPVVKLTVEPSATSIMETENTNSVFIQPNPTTGNIVASFYFTENENARIEIFNMEGKLIRSYKKKFEAGKNREYLSLENLSNGLYFLKISSSERSMKEKFIVEK